MAAPIDRFDGFLEHGLIHGHQVTCFRKTPALYVLGVFLECRDALVLQTLVFFEEVLLGLGMAGNAFVVVLEDVVGEEELRVAAAAGTQGHQKE